MNSQHDPTRSLHAQLTKGQPSLHSESFAGGMVQEMASLPQLRIGVRWFSTGQILKVVIPIFALGAVALVLGAQEVRAWPSVQHFIATYPGVGDFSRPVDSGYPWWPRWQHYLNLFLMLFMIRSGLQILADHPRLYLNGDCTPGSEWFRMRGPGLYYDAHELAHMYHENTILAYEMNGQALPYQNGAPLRLRNELELGFKQVKWIQAIEFVESFDHLGSGEGGFNEDNEYFGYRAPI